MYGLIVSGSGLVPYVDSAFRVEAGMAPVELVVSSGPHSAGKVTDDDCPLCDFFDAINDMAEEESEKEEEDAPEEEEEDDTPEEERTDGQELIPDANLRAAIAAALGKASGAPITQADLAMLDTLDFHAAGRGISDLTGLEYAINLTWLDLFDNHISDISLLEGLPQLKSLYLGWNQIVDISPLAGLTELQNLDLNKNRIVDISPLAGLTKLSVLVLAENRIRDLTPLATRLGPRQDQYGLLFLDVTGNPLNAASRDTHIPALQARSVRVRFDVIVEFTDPQIYNDNLFVLPVTENLAAGIDKLPLRDYAKHFYEHFNDEFDFLIFFPRLLSGQQDPGVPDGGFYHMVKNDVQGIVHSGIRFSSNSSDGYSGIAIPSDSDTFSSATDTFFDSDWGSSGKLQGVIAFWTYLLNPTPHSDIHNGTLLHEIMHRWGNYIVPPWVHWDFSTSGGYLLCTDVTNMIDYGDGKFSYESISPSQYSPLELYLAGFIPAEEVPNWRVAEDGEWLLDEQGWIIEDDNGYRMFTASGFKSYTIEDIIAAYGPRVPDHSQAQKDFRAAVILLVSEDFPATQKILERVSNAVSWFSYAGEDEDPRYNFYEATGGRGTITMDGLSQFKSR